MSLSSLTDEQFQKYNLVSEIFTPSAPTESEKVFAGRESEINRIFDSLLQKGQHIILFGDRGIGKTSLARLVPVLLKNMNYPGAYSDVVNCSTKDTFDSIWRLIFKQFTFNLQSRSIGFLPEVKTTSFSLDQFFPADYELKPEDVRMLVENKIQKGIIVIDEIDRIEDKESMSLLMADTIKTLSDHSVNVTLILVGVAESVIELIKNHISIERCLVQIKLPRLSKLDLIKIIDNGMRILDMEMTDDAKSLISYLSKGMPNYVHGISLYSSRKAILNNERVVNCKNIYSSINDVIENEQLTITSLYETAIFSTQTTIFKEILLACALANTDSLGYFTTSDLRDPLSKILGKDVDIPNYSRQIGKFCNPKKGAILIRKQHSSQPKYKFCNPLLEPYIMVKGLAEGILPEDFSP